MIKSGHLLEKTSGRCGLRWKRRWRLGCFFPFGGLRCAWWLSLNLFCVIWPSKMDTQENPHMTRLSVICMALSLILGGAKNFQKVHQTWKFCFFWEQSKRIYASQMKYEQKTVKLGIYTARSEFFPANRRGKWWKKISRASHVLGVDVSLEQLAISTLDVANPMVHWLSCEKPRESSAVKAWRDNLNPFPTSFPFYGWLFVAFIFQMPPNFEPKAELLRLFESLRWASHEHMASVWLWG